MMICKRVTAMLAWLLTAVLLLVGCLPSSASAQAATGSITVTVKMEKPVAFPGSLTLYRAGEVSREGDSFVPTGDFTEWGTSFGDIAANSPDLARELAGWAAKQTNLRGQTRELTRDSAGTFHVTFHGLEEGLYLLAQNHAATGYYALSPFLVSIPYHGEYQVDVNSKTELLREPEPTEPSAPPGKPGVKLPQTGQLNWPIPILAASGMALFVIGWVLCFRKRDDHAQ